MWKNFLVGCLRATEGQGFAIGICAWLGVRWRVSAGIRDGDFDDSFGAVFEFGVAMTND